MDDSDSGKPKVVFVGHVVIDHNKVEQTSYVRWGSPAMFMMRYLRSNFAINPTIIASYGPDFLQYAGDADLLPRTPNLNQSIVYENIVVNGRRTQYCHNGAAKLPELTPEIQTALQAADMLFLAPLTPEFTAEYVSELMRFLKPDCLKTLLPQGYLRSIAPDGLVSPREFTEAAEIIPHFDLVIISDEDHPKADEVVHGWKQSSSQTNIVVTENVRGADLITSDGIKHIATTPVSPDKIVDSVGLGDVFSAATAYQLHLTRDITKAIKAGHVAAREKLLSPKVY